MAHPVPNNNLRRVMDAALPGLEQDPWFEERVMQRIRQEESASRPVRHRKLSVALAVVLALTLLSVTAVAATLLWHYYRQNITTEAAYGYYQEWPLSEKVALVDRMLEENLAIDTARAGQLHDRSLSDEEKEAVADEIVIGYYGEGHDGVLSAANMMEHDMGQFNTWSLEDQAWFSEQQLANGHKQATYEFHKLPGENDIPADNAVARARDILTDAFDLDRQALETWRTDVTFSSEQISDGVNPTHMEDIYMIAIYEPGYDMDPYGVTLSHDGQLMHMSEARRDHFNDYLRSIDFPLETPEDKARFAQTVTPVIKQGIANGEKVNDHFRYMASIDYIMPSSEYMPEEQAVQLADEAVVTVGDWPEENLSNYICWTSLRRLDDGRAVWFMKYRLLDKFHGPLIDGEITWDYGMKVALDAVTGDVISAEKFDFGTPMCAIKE